MFLSLLLSSFLTFVELNCENLFDCQHDSLKNDIEFTPDGERRWTERKYWNKLDNIGKELLSCGVEGNGWTLPDIIALCEVENDSVMRDLTKRSLLRGANYEYIVTNSPDVRGIDVALMYHPGRFAPINSHSIRITPLPDMRPTRDILYVSGRTINRDTLHIFIVHAPSRYGGERATRPHRLAVAERLGMAIDSLRAITSNPKIIIAGDFNDYKDSPALLHLLSFGLTDASANVTGSHGAKGTYKYQGEWNSLDHIFISQNLTPWLRSCRIHDAPFLLEEDDKYGGVQPFRTYRAWKYRKAYSDHLPLIMKLELPQ